MTQRRRVCVPGGGRRSLWCLAAAGVMWAVGGAGAQQTNPVYMDDAPTATETLVRVQDHLASNNLAEAVRILQVLLDQMPERVVASGKDKDLFLSVRDQVHALLLATPALLQRYREMQEPVAADLVTQGREETVERSYLLTRSGMDAALCVAQRELEGARFEAARLTLAQLETHPDRSGPDARAAAELMALVARYLDRDEVRSVARRWGAEVAQGAETWPEAARRVGQTALDSAPPADLSAMLGKPLRSVPIGSQTAPVPLDEAGNPLRDQLPENAKDLRAMPTVAGDTLYLNDGSSVTAWDRITLARKWQVLPAGEGEGAAPLTDDEQRQLAVRSQFMGAGSMMEEPCTVTVRGRDVVATTGLAMQGMRAGDGRVHAIDAVTGRLRWSVRLDELDPQLASVSVRGPAIISEGVVVVGARRNLPERRLLSLHLVGLDLRTGRLLWHRLVGSAGSLPWGTRNSFLTDAGVLDEGVVYRADMLGVVGAYEAATGRPLWVRRIEPLPNMINDVLSPWQMNAPVLHGGSLIMLSPDRQRVVRLDRQTGAVLGSCKSDHLSTPPPQYLVKAGKALVGVGVDRIAVGPLDGFETGTFELTRLVPEPGIRGRVTAAGAKLLVPVRSGLQVLNTEDLSADPAEVPLDSPGNVLALPSQLVVVDDAYIHSYLLWEVAEQVLTDRMKADPADPSPAVTLAELSYRAGKHGRILGAVDAALLALEKNPKGDAAESSRARLFESVHVMVATSQEPGVGPGTPTPGAPAEELAANLRITDLSLVTALVDRMGKASRTADERVSYLLTLGRLHETRGRAREAIDTYQSVLDDPQLSGATWVGPRLSVRGELEATRRMTKLVREEGASVYAAHEARAAQAIAALPPAPAAGADQLVALATRFPVATGTPGLWERAADAYQAQDKAQAVVSALEAGLEAAERLPNSAWLGALAGRLVTELERREQLGAAAEALRQIRQQHPDLVLTVDGAPVDASALGVRLGERLAARHRWARIGKILIGEGHAGVQTIQGWAMLEPLINERTGSVARALVMKGEGSVALWAPGDQPAAAAGAGGVVGGGPASAGELTAVWRRQIDNADMVDLIRLDSDAALLFFASPKGGAMERVALNPAQTKWRTDLFATPIKDPRVRRAGEQGPGGGGREDKIATPIDGYRSLTDLIVAMDDRTIVVSERSGRATALDAQTGEVLWHTMAPLDRVYDMDLSSGTLVMGGDQAVVGAAGNVVGWKPEIVVLEGRTGQEMQRIPQSKGKVRWLRLTGPGTLIAGLETAVVSFDLARGQTNWTLSDYRLAASRDAWLFDDRLFMLDKERHLWLASVTTGRQNPDPLEAPRSHLGGIRPIQAFALSDGVTAFSTYQGVLLYGPDGVLKGVDAVGGFDSLLPPQPAQKRLVTISTMPDGRRGDAELIYTIHMLDSGSGMLMESAPIIMGAPPRSMALLDGRIAITAGGTTVVLNAPE